MESGELVGEHISEAPLAKAVLGPNLWGNFFNTFFFVNNTIGEKEGFKISKLARHYFGLFFPKNGEDGSRKGYLENFRDEYVANIPGKEMVYATASTLTLWNGFFYANYSYVAEDLRTVSVLAATLVWTCALSLWSLKGGRKIDGKLDLEDRI